MPETITSHSLKQDTHGKVWGFEHAHHHTCVHYNPLTQFISMNKATDGQSAEIFYILRMQCLFWWCHQMQDEHNWLLLKSSLKAAVSDFVQQKYCLLSLPSLSKIRGKNSLKLNKKKLAFHNQFPLKCLFKYCIFLVSVGVMQVQRQQVKWRQKSSSADHT